MRGSRPEAHDVCDDVRVHQLCFSLWRVHHVCAAVYSPRRQAMPLVLRHLVDVINKTSCPA
jgi:hypothetical protein